MLSQSCCVKIALCGGLSLSSLALVGCSNSIYHLYPPAVSSSQALEQAATSEVIRHIGYPTHNGVRQKGSVLVGDNYSYLISTGNEGLDLISQLSATDITIDQPILINRYPDNSVNITLSFRYGHTQNIKKDALSTQQRALLNQLCSNTSFNNCQLQLQGGMYAPLNPINSSVKLDKGLAAKIYSVKDKRVKTQAEVGVIPLKVILETIELPLEILSIIK